MLLQEAWGPSGLLCPPSIFVEKGKKWMACSISTAKGEYGFSRDRGELKHHLPAAKYLLAIVCSLCSLGQGTSWAGLKLAWATSTTWFARPCRIPACLMTCEQNPLRESHLIPAPGCLNPYPGKEGKVNNEPGLQGTRCPCHFLVIIFCCLS